MQEAIELLLNYLRGIWIKRWILVLVAWIVCLIGWPFVLKMPDQYESEAKVYVDTNSLLSPLLRGLTIQTNPAQQIQLMVKTLFTRPNLEKIARLADLDIATRNQDEFDAVVEELKDDLKLQSAGRDNIYTIVYEGESAQKARDVVQAALTTLVENTLGDKRSETNVATSFLDRQIQEYEKRLNESDNALKEFKKRNYELMSDQGGFYQRLEAQKRIVAEVELQVKEARARKQTLERQLAGEVPTFGLVQPPPGLQQLGSTYDSRIDALQAQLDQLRLKYTDAHPNIKETQRVLDELIKRRDEELAEKRALLEVQASQQNGLDQNPVYQEMKLALAREESNLQTLEVRLAEQRRIYEDLQRKINTIPEMEAELQALQRGYEVTLQKYNELLDRRESARLSEQADVSADSFQFRVIDPPRVPTEPTGPNRPLFLSMVLGGALVAGLGMAFLVSQIRPVFFSVRQLNQVTGFPVLGAVSYSASPGHKRATPRRHWLMILMLLLLALYGALMVLQLYPDLNRALINRLPDLPGLWREWLPQLKALASRALEIMRGFSQ